MVSRAFIKIFLRCAGILAFLCFYLPGFTQNCPQRIISLGPALTEEIYILKADDKLVGCTIYCQRPPEAKNKAKVGAAIEVNLEKIVALKPDLILSTSLTNPQAKEKLTNLGFKVIDFPTPKNFNQICTHFLDLGKIIGKEKEAQDILKNVNLKAENIKKKTQGLRRPKVFIQIGSRPLVTVAQDSFINDSIELAGAVNIAQGIKYVRYSRELVIKSDPDVIIIVTMGMRAEEEKATWAKYKTLNAVKNNRIYILDSSLICSPTPVSFAETLEKIFNIIHPQNEQKAN